MILAAAASVVPCVLYIFVYVTNPLPKIIKCDCQFTSSTDEHIYPEEHMSPIFASFKNIHVRQFDIQKCIKHQYKCNYCEKCYKAKVSSKASFCVYTLKSVAVTIYLFGNILEPIFHKYGECIDCDQNCVKILSHISTAVLFLSTIMFHAFPHLVKKIAHWKKWKYEPSEEYNTLAVFSILLKAQSTYSSIVKIFQDNSYCGVSEQA